jgi:methyl-accepting chemotaxis protein
MRSLKQLFTVTFAAVAFTAAGLGFSAFQVWRADAAETQARDSRYRSALLADELRQSSDDLTRLARTFVVSNDPMWEQQYFEVLDIRNGKKPRPAGYEKIYWDFRAAGQTPSGPGHEGASTSLPLLDMMKAAGFSDAEFAKLKEAAGNSDDLVKTETIAMNMVKGLYEDGKGGFTKQGDPDRAKAAAMMHDADYHRYKAKIMKPVDEFLVLLDQRTEAAVTAAAARRDAWFSTLLAFGLLLSLAGLGSLAYSLRWSLKRLGAEPGEVSAVAANLANGDLNVRIENKGSPDSVMAQMARMTAAFSTVVAQVRDNALGVATASAEMSQANTDLSQRTEEQASALQQTASSMAELGSTVTRNADNAVAASQLSRSASDVAVKGGQVVSEVVETMRGINDSSRKIADIIGVIDGIAFQTNILALNAAVEAARAGEQGRGFAVVASEVRNLAQRSAEAAREIKSLITASVERVERGTTLVDQAGATMSEVVASIQRVTDIVAEISAASSAQSSGVSQVGDAVAQMDSVTQQNAALVEQSAAAAESLTVRANELVRAIATFKLEAGANAGAAAVA